MFGRIVKSLFKSRAPLTCFRCGGELSEDKRVETGDDIRFFQCQDCGSDYALHLNGGMTDRWLMPLSVALYGLVCETEIESQLAPTCEQMRSKGSAFVNQLLSHIDDELENPKQRLEVMLSFQYLKEEELRRFLGLLAEKLRAYP